MRATAAATPPWAPATLRARPGLAWMGHRAAFAVGMPALSLLALATSLAIPRLIGPTEFGAYALLLSLFQYAGRSDLGLSQLADRLLAAGGADEAGRRLLDARFRLGTLTIAVAAPVAVVAALALDAPPLPVALAVAAGSSAMMCGGPSSVFRARGLVWELTALGYVFALGFIVPRLLGLMIGGVTGCFTLLLAWYGGVAAAFAIAIRRTGGRIRPHERLPLAATLRGCLPLFAFAGAWMLFLSFNRWMAAALSSPHDLGLFALGANLAANGITTFMQIGEVRYPGLLAALAGAPAYAASRLVEREGLAIAAAVMGGAAAFALLARPLVALAFPQYVGAAPAAVAVAAGCIPLAVVGWFLPVVIARSRTPLRDALGVFAPAFAVTAVAMALGQAKGGVVGQAWGCCLGSATLLACFAAVMHRTELVRRTAAARLAAITCAMILIVAGLAAAQAAPDARLAHAARGAAGEACAP